MPATSFSVGAKTLRHFAAFLEDVSWIGQAAETAGGVTPRRVNAAARAALVVGLACDAVPKPTGINALGRTATVGGGDPDAARLLGLRLLPRFGAVVVLVLAHGCPPNAKGSETPCE